MKKDESYKWAAKRVRAQVLRHVDVTATLANSAAILKEYFPNFFWVGFYFFRHDHLLLGPFQGPAACVTLTLDKGVCATSVRRKSTVIVPDVHEFPGHVACDSRSNSEIVTPLFDPTGAVRAVLDVDSEKKGDFDQDDAVGLEAIAELLRDIWS
ncbi:GAF domain-containing protein [candidate division KSB1 bacterium]|nr:GAF domain-containing protein [candidate division KSB1 bacterium]